jgi:hypothetical protein
MGRPVLWLDSNVARRPGDLRELVARARRKGIRVVVPAQVHLELCRHLRESKRAAFSPWFIERHFVQSGGRSSTAKR